MRVFDYDITNRLVERFNAKWRAQGDCWEWTACVRKNGFGMMAVVKHPLVVGRWLNDYAHRISYQIHIGPIPDNYVVTHTCRNSKCVNPEHLECGTITIKHFDRRKKKQQ